MENVEGSKFDYVKSLLTELYNKPESFNGLPPINWDKYDIEKTKIMATRGRYERKPREMIEIAEKYGIDERELYSILVIFDVHPRDIPENDRKLRVKYINILKKIINENFIQVATDAAKTLRGSYKDIAIQNITNGNLLINRFVDLLMYETMKVDDPLLQCPAPELCPAPEVCPECKKCTLGGIIASWFG